MNLRLSTARLVCEYIASKAKDKTYLTITCAMSAAMSVLFLFSGEHLNQSWPIEVNLVVDPIGWSVLFLVAVALCAISIYCDAKATTQITLLYCAALAGGMSAIFFMALCMGQPLAGIPTILWAYTCFIHLAMTRNQSCDAIYAVEHEIKRLKNEIATIKEPKK